MSHEASNWVLRQRSRSAATQCLLLVIANAADPEGVAFGWWKSRDHWWPYLMERTRLSRGTLFKLLNELEDYGYFTREETKPKEGGRAQPIIRLHLDRNIIEPERPSEIESPRETEEAERATSKTPSQSPTETQNQTQSSPTERPAESPTATTSNVPVLNPESPQSPPLRKPKGIDEANGFGAFWNDYPDHQAMNRDSALRAFAELTPVEQQQAVKTVGFYARDITKLKRRPISAANWLKQRRFSEYGAGRQAGSAGGLVLVAEATEPWQAWCNVAAVAFGGKPHVPFMWAGQGQRGAWVRSTWPLGGEAWLVPLDRWIFVERGTAQHGRWCERINEMFNRDPIPVRLQSVKPSKIIGMATTGESMGLFVPFEWPPPKGTQQSKEHAA